MESRISDVETALYHYGALNGFLVGAALMLRSRQPPVGSVWSCNLDGQLISDMERDDVHREVLRTQSTLARCFGYDAMGRKAWQFASTLPAEKLSQFLTLGSSPSCW